MQPEQNKGLKGSTIGLMIGVALFFDTLQALLAYIFMGWLMIPVFYMTYWMWFRMHGVRFLTLKRAPTQAIGAFLEVATAGIVPAFTFIVARVALTSKVKEITDNPSKVINLDNYRNKKKARNTGNSGENERAA